MSKWAALVLNADFRPVSRYPLSIWPFERTLKGVLSGKVYVVDTYDVELRSASAVYQPPSVVALTRYVHMPQRVPLTRLNLFARDGMRCGYCDQEFSAQDLTFDHVVPRMAGGLSTWENLISACRTCNSRKGHRRDIMPLRVPREPTPSEILSQKKFRKEDFHKSWIDYIYWSSSIEDR